MRESTHVQRRESTQVLIESNHIQRREPFESTEQSLAPGQETELVLSAIQPRREWVFVNFAPNCSDEDTGRFVDGLTSKAQDMGLDLKRATKVARDERIRAKDD